MKYQAYILVLVVSILTSCGSAKRDEAKIPSNDTIVCKKMVRDFLVGYRTYEYFIVNQGTTSSYSYVFRSACTVPYECNMEIINWPSYKKYLIPKDTIISCREPNYKEFLKEMDLCVSAALNKENSANLKHIVFRLANCTDVAIQTSMIFYKTGEKDVTHQNILKALQKTSLKEDFNTILWRHGLRIVQEHCYEEIYLINKSDFRKSYKGNKNLPEAILDVEVCLDIAPARVVQSLIGRNDVGKRCVMPMVAEHTKNRTSRNWDKHTGHS